MFAPDKNRIFSIAEPVIIYYKYVFFALNNIELFNTIKIIFLLFLKYFIFA